MKYRTLGRSGLKVSVLSMGTFSFGGVGDFAKVANHGVKEARRLVDVCLDGGINVFDTANMYSLGRSEEIVGEVLEGRRDRVLISSKARMRIDDTHALHHRLHRRIEGGELVVDPAAPWLRP